MEKGIADERHDTDTRRSQRFGMRRRKSKVGAKTICEVDARDEMIIGISRRRRRRVINWS